MIRTDSRVDDWVSRARAVSIEDAASFVGARLKRNGAEMVGPCVAGCASTDGFAVNSREGVFICRPSGIGGGQIDLVMHARGCSFLEACECLTGEPRPQGAREETAEQCHARETKARERQEAAEQRRREQEAVELSDQERERRVIAQTLDRMKPIFGTHAEAYLRARGLTPGQWCDGFGFIADAPYRHNGNVLARLPVMLAPIVHAPTGDVIGIHRTFLDPDLSKKIEFPWVCRKDEDFPPAKKMYGAAWGGLIPLGPIGETLVIGEGIETTIAYAQNPDLGGEREGLTFAASASLNNLSGACSGTIPHPTLTNPKTGKPILIPNGVPDMNRPGMILPSQVKRLILLGDGDSERLMTRARVLAAARRHRAEGVEVHVHQAPSGHDFASIGFAA